MAKKRCLMCRGTQLLAGEAPALRSAFPPRGLGKGMTGCRAGGLVSVSGHQTSVERRTSFTMPRTMRTPSTSPKIGTRAWSVAFALV